MYRTSNSNTYTGKTELSKSFLVFTGDGNYVNSYSKDWSFVQKVQGNARVYFSNYIGQLSIFKKPIEDSYFKEICLELEKHKIDLIHPSLTHGFDSELKRLFPKVNTEVINLYNSFIKFLQKSYRLSNNKDEEKLIYCDDIGPYMVTKTGLKKSIIPELPNLYLAPVKWRKITWSINNFFIGPLPKKVNNEFYSWGDGFNINNLISDECDEGTVLFLISKFIIIQEAWMDRHSCNSLVNFIDLVMNRNILPFKKLK